ncbi:carbohydrate ABC transporter permease [Brachybacterium sp. AOP24-D1-21]|uniref:carbohydrate ABC transporter permease n=2 Tax=unclassified Brachybacterium TaxID=2623841 RepID=UPI00403341D5
MHTPPSQQAPAPAQPSTSINSSSSIPKPSARKKILGLLGGGLLMAIALIYSFPILYMVLSSFKREVDVAPPSLSFTPTLENYRAVIGPELVAHLGNSVGITLTTVVLTVVLGVPAAYSIVFGRLRNPIGRYNWYITTTLLPAVAVILPIYVILSRLGMLDSPIMMVLLYTSIGIPLMVWMAVTYMADIPQSIIEAAQLDGCTRVQAFRTVILPIVRGGILSTAMLVFIVTWNEFLVAISFTFTQSPTIPVYMNQYMTQQGLFWGKMSAVATIAVLVPVLLGFVAQRSLIKGLLSGAVKE